jgi:pilus assembly protein CpaE
MKIALISPSRTNLQEMAKLLEAGSHTVLQIDGGRNRMRVVAEQEKPDVLVAEGMCCDPADLDQVEYVTANFPQMKVILACATQTPEFLLHAIRAGVAEVVPSPVPAAALEAAISRIAAKRAGTYAAGTGKILAFMPCKGGSGATFLATNLGYQLAETSSVLLIDLNLQFGDALSFVHDGTPAMTLADVARDIRRLDASFLAASTVKIAENYSVLAAPEDPSQGTEIKPEHIEAILDLAVTQYDFVLLDMGRNIDPVSMKALDHAYRIFPVLQAGLPYLRNAKKLLEAFSSLGYPAEKTEPIVNRFDRHSDIRLNDIRTLLGRVVLHTVPNSYKDVNASINQGNPLIKIARSNAVSKMLMDFTRALGPKLDEPRGLVGRLFKRA